MEIFKDVGCLFVSEPYDGIVVKRYAAPDAVVVGRQLALQELVVGGKPLHLHVRRCSKVFNLVGLGYDYEVVASDVVASLVVHEATLAGGAEHVHACVGQRRGVKGMEVSRV